MFIVFSSTASISAKICIPTLDGPGHEGLAFHIAKIPNVTVILAVNRAPMSHISRIIVVSNCRTASTDVPALVNSQTVLPGVQSVQGSIYNARF